MQTYYFTYGNGDTQPFRGGWTEVEAVTRQQAINIYNKIFPKTPEGLIRCDQVAATAEEMGIMLQTGNYGHFCWLHLGGRNHEWFQ